MNIKHIALLSLLLVMHVAHTKTTTEEFDKTRAIKELRNLFQDKQTVFDDMLTSNSIPMHYTTLLAMVSEIPLNRQTKLTAIYLASAYNAATNSNYASTREAMETALYNQLTTKDICKFYYFDELKDLDCDGKDQDICAYSRKLTEQYIDLVCGKKQ
jgi:hypothetical protein